MPARMFIKEEGNMSFRSRSKLFMFALLSALVGCTSPVKQGLDLGDPASIVDAPPPASVSQGDGIKVMVMPLKPSVELGEPIYVALRVTNMRQDPVKIMGGLRPGMGLIEIYSISAKGEKGLLPPLSESDFGEATTLPPQQTRGDVFPIFFGANGWNFKEAGDYRISAQFKVPTQDGFLSFNSEPAVIKVEPSKAGQALFSGDDRSSMEAGKFLVWRSGDHLEAGMKHLMQIAKQHPNSALSSYIFAARAQNYREPFANYIVRQVRAPNCQQANAIRKMVTKNVLPENLLIEDYMSQAKCHAESQDWREAQNSLEAGAKLSADRPEFRAYAQSIAEMQERLRKYLE
jgi:hypothetical protein